MKLSSFSIITIFLVLIVTGISFIPLLSVRLNPSVTYPSVTVFFSWNGANGRIIEQEVTSKMEGALGKIKGVNKVSSLSSNGFGSVSINFDKTVDFDVIRFEVSTLVRQIYPSLPAQVKYPYISVSSPNRDATRPFMSYTINAPATPHLIQKYTEEKIKPTLSSIKGLSEIDVNGASPMEWVLTYDAKRLEILGIEPGDIQNALGEREEFESIGIVFESLAPTPISDHHRNILKQQRKKEKNVIHLVLNNGLTNKNDFLDVPIKKSGEHIVYLRDIVTTQYQEEDPFSYYRINGSNSINIRLYAAEYENQLQLKQQVEEKIKEIESWLPPNYFLLKSYDATEYINKELNKNIWRTLFTVSILLLFILVISRSFRYLLLILITLVANLAIAAIFYYWFKIEIHLYSLAGITVSFGLMIDNSIIMIEHYRRNKNLKVYLASLAATLTTVASLVSVYFLEEKIRIQLIDFSIIIIINLVVSLLITLFFIPALMEKLPLKASNFKRVKSSVFKSKKLKLIYKISTIYEKVIRFNIRFKWILFTVAILTFGLPLYLLPTKIEDEKWYTDIYNLSFGSTWYNENLRSILEKVLGGTLRLFNQDSYSKSKFRDPEKTIIYVNAELPYGSTLPQMNELLTSLEIYLKGFKEIDQFQTSIYSPEQGQITISFKEEFEFTNFPYFLLDELIHKAVDLGGADWRVYGVGDGFNNSFRETSGQYSIALYGYNYDELYQLAINTAQILKKNPRIKELNILSKKSWFKDRSYEFVMNFDYEKLNFYKVSPTGLYRTIDDYTINNNIIGTTIKDGEREKIRLVSQQSKVTDLWNLQHQPAKVNNAQVQLNSVAKLSKEPVSLDIAKENQQYRVILAYDFIGLNEVAVANQEKVINEIQAKMPLGYTIIDANSQNRSKGEGWSQYWMLLLIITLIFFVCAILFESLRQPFAVIFIIPISYIGVFLTFYLFEINFDQGGFASFILLSGITVNSALYIINDYNNLKKLHRGKSLPLLKFYIKAFNDKFIPILLTILSTTLGLIPFLVGDEREVFWPALASGTIGGLIFSLIGIVFYLPLVLGIKRSGS